MISQPYPPGVDSRDWRRATRGRATVAVVLAVMDVALAALVWHASNNTLVAGDGIGAFDVACGVAAAGVVVQAVVFTANLAALRDRDPRAGRSLAAWGQWLGVARLVALGAGCVAVALGAGFDLADGFIVAVAGFETLLGLFVATTTRRGLVRRPPD